MKALKKKKKRLRAPGARLTVSYEIPEFHNGGILLIPIWFLQLRVKVRQMKVTWPVKYPEAQLQVFTKQAECDIFPIADLHKGLEPPPYYVKCLLHSLFCGEYSKNAFMAFCSVSHQKIAICIQERVFIPCMYYGTLAYSEERLSHYCANDMQLLKEHFERAE